MSHTLSNGPGPVRDLEEPRSMAEEDHPTGAGCEASSHLRRLLLAAGVGTVWSHRELARKSGHQLPRARWDRMMKHIPRGEYGTRWSPESLQLVSETLLRVGVRIPLESLKRAVAADLGYGTTTTGDELSEVLSRVEGLSTDEKLQLLRELAQQIQPPDGNR